MMLKRKSKSLNQLKAVFLILFSGIFIYACSNANSNSKEKSANEQEIATQNTETASEQQQSNGTFANPVDMSKVISRVQTTAREMDAKGNVIEQISTNTIFEVPDNTPVYAVLPGKVEVLKKGKDVASGFGVLINHDDGLVTLYENCQSTLADNTEVKQGEQIGVLKKAPDSRNAKQGQLLFAIMKDTHSFNPDKIFDFDTQMLKVALKDISISNKGLEPWPLKTTIRFVPPVIKKDGKQIPPPVIIRINDGQDSITPKKTVRFTPPVIKKDGEQAPPPPPIKSTKKDEIIENKDGKDGEKLSMTNVPATTENSPQKNKEEKGFSMTNISATSEKISQKDKKDEVLQVSISDVPKKEDNVLQVSIKDVSEKKDDTLRVVINDVKQ